MKTPILPAILAAALFAAGPASADPAPVKLSSLARSIVFRDGAGHRGNYGFNGGSYSSSVFDGNFENYVYQNTAGAEIVIPTTDASTGNAWYVTDFKVGHKGNTQYSLYYTTEAEPANILSNAKDPRAWKPIPDATSIADAAGTKTYSVYGVVTAVKYVFDTVIGWTPSLGELEVWGMDPAAMDCLHSRWTEWADVPGTATCTGFGIEQRQCADCGEWFRRESSTVFPLGHIYETVLVERGTSLAYGHGTNVCRRCGGGLAFPEPKDLATLGGVAAPGIVHFTDVTVSSTGDPSYGQRPDFLIDNVWDWSWGHYWYANTKSDDEYVQFDFAAPTDLTSVDISVANHAQTLRFYALEGVTETLVGETAVTADGTNNEYQRMTIEFRGVTLSSLRIKKADDPNNKLTISEVHPYGTVAGAGKAAAVRTRIIID